MKIFITGGTGLVGRALIARLTKEGHSVLLLTRSPQSAEELGRTCELIEGDPGMPGPWTDRLDECDAVVHLAGENLFKRRWSEPFLRKVRDSRVESTRLIAEHLAEHPRRADGTPRVLVNASAVGYYGDRGDEELTEASTPGTDRLSLICIEWERATEAAREAGVRVTMIRVGMVLDARGGALPLIARPFKLFAGGWVGSGRQVMSWVHIDDLVGIIVWALENDQVSGPVNGTSPNPVTNREFSRTLARVLRRPCWLPVPKFMLKLGLGGAATVAISSQRVQPTQALEGGYTFQFPELDPALRELYGRAT